MRTEVLTRRPPASVLLGLCGAALLIGAAATAEAGWDGQQDIRLGDQVASEFVGDPLEEVHQFEFFAPTGTKLTAILGVARGATLTPEVKLFTVQGVEVPLGPALSVTRVLKIRNFEFTTGGRHYLQVRATAGSGEYKMKTKGRFPRLRPVTTQELSFEFDAVAGSMITGIVSPGRRSPARPVFDALTGPRGDVALGGTDLTRFRNVTAPFDGDYELEWINNGTAGDMKLRVTVRAPRSRRKFGFGPAEKTEAVPDLLRDSWMGSGHADRFAEAFTHWDEDGSVSTSCARCHSSGGYQDYLGADGTAFGVVDNEAALGTTVDCNACHNAVAQTLDEVTFPSGQMYTNAGPEARCMTCHQGRESTVSMDAHIAKAIADHGGAIGDDDKTPNDGNPNTTELSFRNIHYFAAGATLFGGDAKGGYQYAGNTYDGRNPHVESYDVCQECHNPHTLELKLDECTSCHAGVMAKADLDDIRMAGSVRDYDGDGMTNEGIKKELETLGEALYAAIQEYATNVAMAPIVYDSHSYPYFFNDDDPTNGMPDPSETNFGNRYADWTPRLLRAAYNYQYWQKDPGAFAHNPRYIIELLYDSLADLDSHAMVTVPNLSMMWRNDTGHFDATAEAYRHWDDDEEPVIIGSETVSSSCSLCHSPGGFEFWAEFGLVPATSFPVSDGLRCETCHVGGDFADASPKRKFIAEVEFPSGVTLENDDQDPDDSFICMTCHKGRQAKKDVDDRIAGTSPLSFRNVHYLPAAAVLYGNDVEVGYEYPAQAGNYDGKWVHNANDAMSECTYCHLSDHTFKPQVTTTCTSACHAGQTTFDQFRLMRPTDYDGDGDTGEPLKDEIKTLGEALYDAIRAYAKTIDVDNDQNPDGIVYDSSHYPYWFYDLDDNGVPDLHNAGTPDEENKSYNGNSRATPPYPSMWDAALLKAAFNYQLWQKEPGAWAHNTDYIAQLLIDSISDLGDPLMVVGGFNRP